jgi:selenocysteine-specific elongation factor
LVPVSQDVIFRKKDYDEMVEKVRAELQRKGSITLGEVRNMLNTTRKYIQALLEHLDSTGLTMRDGDFRKLRK